MNTAIIASRPYANSGYGTRSTPPQLTEAEQIENIKKEAFNNYLDRNIYKNILCLLIIKYISENYTEKDKITKKITLSKDEKIISLFKDNSKLLKEEIKKYFDTVDKNDSIPKNKVLLLNTIFYIAYTCTSKPEEYENHYSNTIISRDGYVDYIMTCEPNNELPANIFYRIVYLNAVKNCGQTDFYMEKNIEFFGEKYDKFKKFIEMQLNYTPPIQPENSPRETFKKKLEEININDSKINEIITTMKIFEDDTDNGKPPAENLTATLSMLKDNVKINDMIDNTQIFNDFKTKGEARKRKCNSRAEREIELENYKTIAKKLSELLNTPELLTTPEPSEGGTRRRRKRVKKRKTLRKKKTLRKRK